jgi:hypothetical protein
MVPIFIVAFFYSEEKELLTVCINYSKLKRRNKKEARSAMTQKEPTDQKIRARSKVVTSIIRLGCHCHDVGTNDNVFYALTCGSMGATATIGQVQCRETDARVRHPFRVKI